LTGRIQELFDSVHLQTNVTDVDEQDEAVRVEFEGDDPPDSQSFDQMLVAIGRRPNFENLGLDRTSVELDENGITKLLTDPDSGRVLGLRCSATRRKRNWGSVRLFPWATNST